MKKKQDIASAWKSVQENALALNIAKKTVPAGPLCNAFNHRDTESTEEGKIEKKCVTSVSLWINYVAKPGGHAR